MTWKLYNARFVALSKGFFVLKRIARCGASIIIDVFSNMQSSVKSAFFGIDESLRKFKSTIVSLSTLTLRVKGSISLLFNVDKLYAAEIQMTMHITLKCLDSHA